MSDTLDVLAEQLKAFARARDWEQFHAPKNLACALSVEAGELLEHFQWMTEEQSRALASEKREAVAAEMADVLLYLVQLASSLNVDLREAALRKIKSNDQRYPAERARGSSRKHDEL
jgi:dCTP diphosphatase